MNGEWRKRCSVREMGWVGGGVGTEYMQETFAEIG